MTREEMINVACQTFGLENEWAIAFCTACEELDNTEGNDSILHALFYHAFFRYKMENLAEGIEDEGEF